MITKLALKPTRSRRTPAWCYDCHVMLMSRHIQQFRAGVWLTLLASCLGMAGCGPGLASGGEEGAEGSSEDAGGSEDASGGTGQGVPPEPPQGLSLTPAPTKRFIFEWEAVPGAQEYQLLEQVDPEGEFVAVGPSTGDPEQTLIVPLHLRAGARYRVRACNPWGCADSDSVEAIAPLADAIGYLKHPDPWEQDQFGWVRAMTRDGSTIFVTTQNETLAYAWSDETGWKSSPELFPPMGVAAIDGDGDTVVSGAQGLDGGIGVYTRQGEEWIEEAQIGPLSDPPGYYRSYDLDDEGDTLAICYDGHIFDPVDVCGVAERVAPGQWEVAELLEIQPGGGHVVLSGSGETLALCTGGRVRVHARDPMGGWPLQAELAPEVLPESAHCKNMAINYSGEVIVTGTDQENSDADGINGDPNDDSAVTAGAAWVFERGPGEEWSQRAYLKAINSSSADYFGWDVAIDDAGDLIAVSAFREGTGNFGVTQPNGQSVESSGAVYLFERDALGEWAHRSYLKAPNPGVNDRFGWHLNMSGDGQLLLASAPYEDSDAGQKDDSMLNAGALYSF